MGKIDWSYWGYVPEEPESSHSPGYPYADPPEGYVPIRVGTDVRDGNLLYVPHGVGRNTITGLYEWFWMTMTPEMRAFGVFDVVIDPRSPLTAAKVDVSLTRLCGQCCRQCDVGQPCWWCGTKA